MSPGRGRQVWLCAALAAASCLGPTRLTRRPHEVGASCEAGADGRTIRCGGEPYAEQRVEEGQAVWLFGEEAWRAWLAPPRAPPD